MRKAIKQIGACAGILLLFCLACRLVFFRSYTVWIPIPAARGQVPEEARIRAENPDVIQVDRTEARPGHLRVSVRPGKRGDAEIRVFGRNGEEQGSRLLRVGPLGTVYDLQTGGFTGDTAVMIAVTLFWLAVSAIMIWHYRQAVGEAYYAYSTVYYAGFSLFALVSGLMMLRVTVSHLFDPATFNMLMVYGAVNGAGRNFMTLTMPAAAAFALAMIFSNAALLRHATPRVRNLLGILIGLLILGGEVLGWFLFTRDLSGSEQEVVAQDTVNNVYATVFAYFECMLAGSVICGIRSARYQPPHDKDFIVILGCWFRDDGTLPPLLRGRVDRAIGFWREQKEKTGREAILIPSGGRGWDEPMPEAEAMRNYLIAEGIPAEAIRTEPRAVNTFQNMAFSREIIEQIRPRAKTAYATTNYHVFRSGVWAAEAGLPAEGIGSRTKWWYWPNAFMRECAGLLLKRWKQELLFLLILVAFFAALSMVVR